MVVLVLVLVTVVRKVEVPPIDVEVTVLTETMVDSGWISSLLALTVCVAVAVSVTVNVVRTVERTTEVAVVKVVVSVISVELVPGDGIGFGGKGYFGG